MGFLDCIFSRKEIKEMKDIFKEDIKFSKDILGAHINPVLMGEGYQVNENDIKRLSKTFKYIVSNFWPQWWMDQKNYRYKMIHLMRWCVKYNVKLIVRIDDPSITEGWSSDEGKNVLEPNWFFTKHIPYIMSILEENENVKRELGSGIFALQIMNEPWVDGNSVLTGAGVITPKFYITYLKEVLKHIKMKDNSIKILSCAVTTFVEKKYFKVLNELLDNELLSHVDGLSLHWYDHLHISVDHFKRLKKISERISAFPVYITETNCINTRENDNNKFRVIEKIYKMCLDQFNLKSFCIFCYNEDTPIKEWAFRKINLQRLIEINSE